MEHQKTTYEVQLAGIPLRLKTSHDQATVDRLVEKVNEKVQMVTSEQSSLSFQQCLLLASLHLAEDFLKTNKSALLELEAIETQAKSILSDLESSPISRIRVDS